LTSKKTIVILGGGAAGIMTALQLSSRYSVYLVEQKKTLGRKLLVAGKGGFNLTNNAVQDKLVISYQPSSFLEASLRQFSAQDLRVFLRKIGIDTFVGSSNRVFPVEGVKPVEVLNALISELTKKGVHILLNHKVVALNQENVYLINDSNKRINLAFDYGVLALGGASWTKTGSDGKWVDLFKNSKIKIKPFVSSNCGVNISWNNSFLESHEGKPLKNIALSVNGFKVKGEALITSYGLEGNAIYPIVKELRLLISNHETPVLKVDFKPKNSLEDLLQKIKKKKPSQYAKALNLSSHEMALIKQFTSKEEFLDPVNFIKKVKELSVFVSSLRPIEESISTVGGIAIENLNNDFSLKEIPTIYTVGEMVDWDAPTGGFLLQGCFSMAYNVANSINLKLPS
jgi:hypothetical protein